MIEKLGSLSTQALIDGLWVMGWPGAHIEGARSLAPGQKCAGRAVTLNFVPQRPDIQADKPPGGESPEYEGSGRPRHRRFCKRHGRDHFLRLPLLLVFHDS